MSYTQAKWNCWPEINLILSLLPLRVSTRLFISNVLGADANEHKSESNKILWNGSKIIVIYVHVVSDCASCVCVSLCVCVQCTTIITKESSKLLSSLLFHLSLVIICVRSVYGKTCWMSVVKPNMIQIGFEYIPKMLPRWMCLWATILPLKFHMKASIIDTTTDNLFTFIAVWASSIRNTYEVTHVHE